MRRSASCITRAVIVEGRFATDALPALSFGQRWAPREGSRNFACSLLERHWLVANDDEPHARSNQTAGGFHQFRRRDGDDVVGFAWHPVPGQVPWRRDHVHDIMERRMPSTCPFSGLSAAIRADPLRAACVDALRRQTEANLPGAPPPRTIPASAYTATQETDDGEDP